MTEGPSRPVTLSVVIPCFNEAKTLRQCVEAVRAIANDDLRLDIIIVDDASTDDAGSIADELAKEFAGVRVEHHETNRGKGAALRTGFALAVGDFVAIQDADLEYDPQDLCRLIGPLRDGRADVVFGSRYLTTHQHRVLMYWHTLGNRFLTWLSNMLTDMNLTDMETCYKVFRRDVIQSIELEEDRFGFEPEVVAKIADRRLRVYEMGISYHGRSYADGKKIGVKDGFRALYCILRYNGYRTSLPIQFLIYLMIGATAAVANLLIFLMLLSADWPPVMATSIAFAIAALLNYWLCIRILFRHRSRWNAAAEWGVYLAVVVIAGTIDTVVTLTLLSFLGSETMSAAFAKAIGTLASLLVNFFGRRQLVFAGKRRGPW